MWGYFLGIEKNEGGKMNFLFRLILTLCSIVVFPFLVIISLIILFLESMDGMDYFDTPLYEFYNSIWRKRQ